MYYRLINGLLNLEFLVGLEEYIEFASSKPEWINGNKIKCPCTLTKCQNCSYHQIDTVKYNLMKNGFIPRYYVWARQGEMEPDSIQNSGDAQPAFESVENAYHSMVMDAVRSDFNPNEISDEPPNLEAQNFFNMLSAVNKELWPSCKKHSQLSLVAIMLNMKVEHHMSKMKFCKTWENYKFQENGKLIIINCQNGSGKPRKFSRSQMTKWTMPLDSSREI